MRIAVAGGTGLAGAAVVTALTQRGHEAVVLARSTGVDLIGGAGVDAALTDIDAVIDTTNLTTRSATESVAFFGAVTQALLAAEQRCGVGHHVALSIVGIDRVDIGYYRGKRRQEELIQSGPVPHTILRATQFHEFAGQVLGQASLGPISLIPRMRSAPIAVGEVASHLVDAALAAAQNRTVELAGPRVEEMPDLVRRLLARAQRRRVVVPIRLPGAGGRAMAAGGLLPTGDGPRGTETFEAWLEHADLSPWV